MLDRYEKDDVDMKTTKINHVDHMLQKVYYLAYIVKHALMGFYITARYLSLILTAHTNITEVQIWPI